MRHLVRYNPNNSLGLLDDFDKIFGSYFNGFPSKAVNTPVVDIIETEDEYKLDADLPGLNENDIDIKVENDVLTISSEVSEEKKSEESGYLIRERKSRAFSRSFVLPKNVNKEEITAEFHNGVLELHLPKMEEAKPKSISIKVK